MAGAIIVILRLQLPLQLLARVLDAPARLLVINSSICLAVGVGVALRSWSITTAQKQESACLAHVLLLAWLVRLATATAFLLHEWAHLCAAILVDAAIMLTQLELPSLLSDDSPYGRHKKGVLDPVHWANVLGNVPLSAWLRCLLLRPLPRSPFVHIHTRSPVFVRTAAPVVSTALAWATWWVASERLLPNDIADVLCVAAWAVAAASVKSDLLLCGEEGTFRCGNFGCLLQLTDERVAALDSGPRILERMCAITQVRGGQAAGIASLTSQPPVETVNVLHKTPSYRLRRNSIDGSSRNSIDSSDPEGTPRQSMAVTPLDMEMGVPRDTGRPSKVTVGAYAPPLISSIRQRLVNTKRGDMPRSLRQLYQSAAGHEYPEGAGSAAFIGHTRFATASLPAVKETHPHEWTPFRDDSLWVFAHGKFQLERRRVGIHLTHNGDLDAVSLFKRAVEVGELGLWLERVLHMPNDTRGDSPKGAGMMELLCCQGIWASAVRWAYQDVVALSLLDASGGHALSKTAPNTAPGPGWWDAWATMLNDVTEQRQEALGIALECGGHRFVTGPVMPFVECIVDHIRSKLTVDHAAALGLHPDNVGKAASGNMSPAALAHLEEVARQNGCLTLMPPLALRKFLKRAVEAWLHADVADALRQLLSRATGSFGVTVLSACEPDTVAIAAKGQQMSLALHSGASIALYGSEAAAMKVPVACSGSDIKSWEFMTHRMDLDESHGEVLRLSLRPRPVIKSAAAADALLIVSPDDILDESALHRKEGALKPASWGGFMWSGLHIDSFRFKTRKEVTGYELRTRLVPLLDNPLVQPLPLLSGPAQNDPVGADIEAIPQVLARVRSEWQDAESLNRMTATAFARMLLEKMAHNQHFSGSAHEARDMDVLIVGVEISLWMAEQFAADLTRALPHVHAQAMSANKVLHMFGTEQPDVSCTGFPGMARATLPVRNAIVLVVSQSGQTFPVLNATRLLRHTLGDRVFVLTGEYDTKMGLVVGQNYARPQSAHFCCRIFSNLSGWRPAEPTTVAACAAHATLTELLVFLLHAYTIELQPDEAHALLGLTMNRDDVRCLAELRDASTLQSVPELCLRADGKSTVGLSIREAGMQIIADWTAGGMPGVHENLVAAGQEWACRINEGWHATVFNACYVAGTILFQWAPFNVVSVLVGAGGPFYFVCQTSAKKCVIGFALRFIDVVIYIWIGWLFLLLRRRLLRRPVFARRGKRVLVIADVPWVHQSIEIYVSKLFALAYGDNGLDVHGANPVDSFVHRFTHRVQRGVLIALGRPDGRVSSLSRVENACLLAAMQAAAIQNLGTGPEIVSVGHNTHHGNPSAIARHVVLPTHRRPFTCEFLAKTVLGATDSHGRMDPTAILAKLGAGVVVTPEAMLLSGSNRNMCDRCGDRAAKKVCLNCGGQQFCILCSIMVHAHGGPESKGHVPLPILAALRMRLKARQARVRLLLRKGEGNDAGDGAQQAQTVAFDALGADVGSAFPGFGIRSAAIMLKGHGKLLAAQGAPLGMHHARALLSHVAADRARQRWKTAITAVCAARNPWKRLLMDLAAQGEESFSKFANVIEEVDIASHALLAAEAPMKDVYEGRFASLERYIAFLVMFHAMALRVSFTSWPLPPWDISRSQSILRVASTAAPVSGAEVAAQLAGEAAHAAFVVRRRHSVAKFSAEEGEFLDAEQ